MELVGASDSGVGVNGSSKTGIGVAGTAGTLGSTGIGVSGSGSDTGVVGSGNVVGVRGAGPTIGILGGGNLTGVKGISVARGGSGGYGGDFEGELAPVWLRPSKTQGSPSTGAHNMGELYVDNQGVLYFCVASGTPGTWKTVQLV
ncbi:MAG TPA: hypothetical protein VEL11_16625 [Candidatus Bathyarchaeia archaeon]|nr:hypothetical protein [Candidatus Bathyarchaeia archaeon]